MYRNINKEINKILKKEMKLQQCSRKCVIMILWSFERTPQQQLSNTLLEKKSIYMGFFFV